MSKFKPQSRSQICKKPNAISALDSGAYLDAILESTVDGIIVIDERGIIETFNKAAQEMFGYALSEVVGQNVARLMPPPYAANHDAAINNYLRTGRARIIGIGREVVGLRKDGTVFPLELAVSEVRVGTRRTFTGLVRDITQRKRLEREILEVSERTQRQIGRELHDGTCQEIAGIAFQLRALHQQGLAAGAVEPSSLLPILELLQNAVRHARTLSHSLYPVDADPNGLRVALEQLAASITELSRVTCTFHCPKWAEVHGQEIATQLYRIAQEAVRDAVGRGCATRIDIELLVMPATIVVSIADNRGNVPGNGHGQTEMTLALMRHRAAVIGAGLNIQSATHGGVTVTCELPQHHAAD